MSMELFSTENMELAAIESVDWFLINHAFSTQVNDGEAFKLFAFAPFGTTILVKLLCLNA